MGFFLNIFKVLNFLMSTGRLEIQIMPVAMVMHTDYPGDAPAVASI